MKYIALAGQMHNGKTTVARWLAEHFSLPLGAFADTVKETLSQLTGVPLAQMESYKNSPELLPGWVATVRQSYQMLGDGMKHIKPTVWIDKQLAKGPQVIHDLRYRDEATICHERGFYNVLVFRPGFDNDDPHPSEFQIGEIRKEILTKQNYTGPIDHPLFHFLLVNQGNLDALQHDVRTILIPAIHAVLQPRVP